jgi:hypothetical protein
MMRTTSGKRIVCTSILVLWSAIIPSETVAQEFDVASVKVNKSGVFASSLEVREGSSRYVMFRSASASNSHTGVGVLV